MLITRAQEKKLDSLYQETILENSKHRSLLGGSATVVHHFKPKGIGFYSLRWYIPNGIPLAHWQHDFIHGKNGKEFESIIIKIKGAGWLEDLEVQKRKLTKFATYQDVVNHIKGKSANYV